MHACPRIHICDVPVCGCVYVSVYVSVFAYVRYTVCSVLLIHLVLDLEHVVKISITILSHLPDILTCTDASQLMVRLAPYKPIAC